MFRCLLGNAKTSQQTESQSGQTPS